MSNFYPVSSLIGGGSGALDALAHTNADGFGTPLATGDIAIVGSSASPKVYRYDSTDTTAENSPHVIEPDSGGGAWICVTHLNVNNLLPNSRFSAWTGGTPTAVATIYSNSFPANVDGWSGYAGATPSWNASGHMNSTTSAQWGTVTDNIEGAFTPGKLYRLSGVRVYCASDSKVANVKIISGGSLSLTQALTTVASSWVTMDPMYFVSDHVNVAIHLQHATDTTAFSWDDVIIEEYAPSIGVSGVACDHWAKSGSITSSSRGWAADFGLPGQYCVHIVPTAVADAVFYWPKAAQHSDPSWINLVKGRTLTFGAWVVADVADQVCLSVVATGGASLSPYHTGGGTAEWLEVSKVIPDSTALAYAAVRFQGSVTNPAYFSQPMLVLGDHIGAGNYQPIPGENLDFDAVIPCYMDGTLTAATPYPFNIEAMTEGKIGAVKGFFGRISGIAGTAGKFFGIRQSAAVTNYGMITSAVNTTDFTLAAGRQILQPNGFFEVFGQTSLTISSVVFTGAVLQ